MHTRQLVLTFVSKKGPLRENAHTAIRLSIFRKKIKNCGKMHTRPKDFHIFPYIYIYIIVYFRIFYHDIWLFHHDIWLIRGFN